MGEIFPFVNKNNDVFVKINNLTTNIDNSIDSGKQIVYYTANSPSF